jgi:hypothetical protein
MPFKMFLLCVCVGLLWGCKNEPYEELPLGVSALLNHDTNITGTFKYKDKKIFMYVSATTTDTLASMHFIYERDQLARIISDSTEDDYKETIIYRPDPVTVIDSSFRYIDGAKSFFATRKVTYNSESNPALVTQTIVGDGTVRTAELNWQDGNVTSLSMYNGSGAAKTPINSVTISYDEENCVYTKNTDYLYTLPIGNLYWLSKNNPSVFNYGESDKKYTYWYNKMGYPSNFKSDTDVLFGVSYTQIR